jgi:hypothetical protein
MLEMTVRPVMSGHTQDFYGKLEGFAFAALVSRPSPDPECACISSEMADNLALLHDATQVRSILVEAQASMGSKVVDIP